MSIEFRTNKNIQAEEQREKTKQAKKNQSHVNKEVTLTSLRNVIQATDKELNRMKKKKGRHLKIVAENF